MTGVVKPKRQKRLTKKRKAEIKAKTKARKRIAKENQKKREAKKLPIYEIPSTILDTYKQEVLATDSVYLSLVRSKCHQQTYEEFSSLEVPTNLANFLTAFKHATEDRNFKLLYELLGKAIKIRDTFLLQQIYEVSTMAVSLVFIFQFFHFSICTLPFNTMTRSQTEMKYFRSFWLECGCLTTVTQRTTK